MDSKPLSAEKIAYKYVHGEHDALTDAQEKIDMAADINALVEATLARGQGMAVDEIMEVVNDLVVWDGTRLGPWGGDAEAECRARLLAMKKRGSETPTTPDDPKPVEGTAMNNPLEGELWKAIKADIEKAAMDYCAEPFGDGDVKFNREKHDQFVSVMVYVIESTNILHKSPRAKAESAESVPMVDHHAMGMIPQSTANWYETAAQFARDMEYYRGLVDRIGIALGDAAKTCDDGTMSEDILRAKVPELVEARLASLGASDQWIPVSSGKLPEDGTYVEIYDPATEPELPFDIARYDDGEWHGQIAPMKLNPTHWKPWKCVPPGAGRVEDIDPVAP